LSRLPHLRLTPIVTAAALLAIVYLSFTTIRYVVHDHRLHQQEAQVRRDIGQLDRDHERLVAVRDYLKSDEYIEDVARRILGLVRPGETLVVVSGATPVPVPTPTAAAADARDEPWWQQLFGGVEVPPTATAR